MKEGESKLTVGPNIKLKGVEITDCDTLVVEGSVEATMDSRVIQISERGAFKGSAEIDVAEIRGVFEGNLTVRQKLVIYSTGKVTGKVRYGKVVIEEGGQLSGEIESGTGPKTHGRAAHRPAAGAVSASHGRAAAAVRPLRLRRRTGAARCRCPASPRAGAATSCPWRRSRPRCSRRSPAPRPSRGCAGCR